jgi:hypothetical protein
MGTLGPALFALQQQMQQQPQQQQTPQAPPVQPGTTDDPLTNAMVSSMQTGQQQFQQDVGRRAQLAQQLQQLQAQQSGSAPMSDGTLLRAPKTGYEPHFQPMNSVGHVLGDIGKGALLGLSATGPGRAVSEAVYGPGERRYATQAGSLANQIAEIQKQMGSESEAMQAASGMASKPMAAAARYQVGVMNNQTRQLHDRAMEGLRGQFQQLQQQIAAGKLTQEQARTKAMVLIGQGHDQAIQSVAGTHADQADRDTQIKAFEDEYKVGTDNMLKQWFGDAMGIAPQAPSKSPTAAPGPKAAGSKVQSKPSTNKPGGVVKWGRDAQGNPVRVQ